jgi:GNAT superfamily N-acetyltransferase
MVDSNLVPYNDAIHRMSLFDLEIEHASWIANEVKTRYGIELVPQGNSIRDVVESIFPMLTSIKPPEGIIYILEVDGIAEGMGVLRKQSDGIAEIRRMYIRPKYRGMGLGKEMVERLEEKAREFGYLTLKLDTSEFMVAALHIYRKMGFKESEAFSDGSTRLGEGIRIYMEKQL